MDNPFDRVCRFIARQDPDGLLRWLLTVAPGSFHFAGWLNTQLVPWPGDPERICDTVARLEDPAGSQSPWVVPLEFQIEPDALMFGRLLIYLGNLWIQYKPSPERGDRFQLAALVVNLTGRGQTARKMEWNTMGFRTQMQVIERNLCAEEAQNTLTGIEAGTITRWALPFIPLMHGGADAATIERWLKLAADEPEAQGRKNLATSVLMLADATNSRPVWHEALKGWEVMQSQFMLEGQAIALAESVLVLLQHRFGTLPATTIERVEKVTDPKLLTRWNILAADATDLEAFWRAVSTLPAPK